MWHLVVRNPSSVPARSTVLKSVSTASSVAACSMIYKEILKPVAWHALVLFCVTRIASCDLSYNESQSSLIFVNSVAQLNTEIQNKMAIDPTFFHQISVWFENCILSERITLTKFTSYDNYTLQFGLKYFKGFMIADFTLFLSITTNHKLAVVFYSGIFQFYDKHEKLLVPSCDSFLKSYYDLSDKEYASANKSQLISNYTGLFGTYFPYLFFYGNVQYSSTPICPLLFKGI